MPRDSRQRGLTMTPCEGTTEMLRKSPGPGEASLQAATSGRERRRSPLGHTSPTNPLPSSSRSPGRKTSGTGCPSIHRSPHPTALSLLDLMINVWESAHSEYCADRPQASPRRFSDRAEMRRDSSRQNGVWNGVPSNGHRNGPAKTKTGKVSARSPTLAEIKSAGRAQKRRVESF